MAVDPCAPASWLTPPWASHDGPVGALMTTRDGGTSVGAYASMNVGDAVGDEPSAVAASRRRLAAACGAAPVFLRQVHGARAVRIGAADGFDSIAPPHDADASWTTEPGVACVVQVADCLPVLFAAPDGRAVAAAHAGWRGLAAGVVEATLDAVVDAAGCQPADIDIWLGACIGPRSFEVGADVLDAFGAARAPGPRFVAHAAGKWLADLRGLAEDRLRIAGARRITASDADVVAEPTRFFSYRRDRVCGRMAAAIWIRAR